MNNEVDNFNNEVNYWDLTMPTEFGVLAPREITQESNRALIHFINACKSAEGHLKSWCNALKAGPKGLLPSSVQSIRAGLQEDIRTMVSNSDRIMELQACAQRDHFLKAGYDCEHDSVTDVDRFLKSLQSPDGKSHLDSDSARRYSSETLDGFQKQFTENIAKAKAALRTLDRATDHVVAVAPREGGIKRSRETDIGSQGCNLLIML